MTQVEVYAELETIMGLPAGSIAGNEELQQLKAWDSLAIVEFIAFADTQFGKTFETEQLDGCRTVPDLLALLELQ